MACVLQGDHTDELNLPLLPSRKASLPFGWYSLRLPKKGWPGWVDLGGWSHITHRELSSDTVTHPSTNRARCSLTSLIETNALPLRQTITVSKSSSSSLSFYLNPKTWPININKRRGRNATRAPDGVHQCLKIYREDLVM